MAKNIEKQFMKAFKSSAIKDLALALLYFYPDVFGYDDIELILKKANGCVPDFHLQQGESIYGK